MERAEKNSAVTKMEYHCRKFLRGMDKMKKTEHERDALEKHLCLIKDIANVENDQTIENLALLCPNSKKRRPESSPKNLKVIAVDSGSILLSSDSDLTEEDVKHKRTKCEGGPPPKKSKTRYIHQQLASALLPGELEQLSPTIREKLEAHLKSINDELDEKRVQLEQQKAESAVRRANEIYRANAVQQRFDEHDDHCTRIMSEQKWELAQLRRAHQKLLNERNSVAKTENSHL